MLKRALLLTVIQPSLGGVLIRGTKGVAKSTAVRALAALLPAIDVVVGCPFQRRPGEEIPDWPLPVDAVTATKPLPLIELPLGATEDRLLGSLHLEKALRGERAFEPGLLAAANRGILYVDEVNLLPDHLVDVLLDAAASGRHRVEREGLSISHPARFVLIGTMNPEEGELRPQLLDRFGLVVDASDLTEPADRAEAVRRRLAYEASPQAFAASWSEADAVEAERVVQAQRLLPRVHIADSLVRAVSERCLAAGVQGLRADLTVCRAACAWAAYHGRTTVETADVDAVAELALAHRRTQPPEPPSGGPRNAQRESRTGPSEAPSANHAPSSLLQPPAALVLSSAGLFAPRPQPSRQALAGGNVAGRWRNGGAARRGRIAGPVALRDENGSSVAWAATLRAAAPYQAERKNAAAKQSIVLRAADVHFWRRHRPAGCLLLFLIDGSGSMAAWKRMRQTKSAILALLLQAYQRRDRIAFLVFRGQEAKLILPPTRSLRTTRRVLEELPVGGATPLAHGLVAASRLIHQQRRRQPRQPIWTVLLTDGKANVTLATNDPWLDALAQARALRTSAAEFLVVDTETGWLRFGKAAELACALGANSLSVEEVLGPPIHDPDRLSAVG